MADYRTLVILYRHQKRNEKKNSKISEEKITKRILKIQK